MSENFYIEILFFVLSDSISHYCFCKSNKVKNLYTTPFLHSLETEFSGNRIFSLYNFDTMINLRAAFQQ